MRGSDAPYILFGVTEDGCISAQHWAGTRLIFDPLGKPLKFLLRLENGTRVVRTQVLAPTSKTVKMVTGIHETCGASRFDIGSAVQSILADLSAGVANRHIAVN